MPGKAANIAPPAVISQTSLPSQTGPMVLSAARRRFSASSLAARPNSAISIPTPKSKPSSTKNPRKSAASAMNQKSCSPISSSSVRERQRRELVAPRGTWRRGLGVVLERTLDDVAPDQPEPEDGQHRVEEREHGERGEHHAHAVPGDAVIDRESEHRVPRRIRHDHPRLSAHFREHPAG